MNPSIITIIFGAVTAVLGAQAYFAPTGDSLPSPVSLLAGGVSGLILIAAGFAMLRGAFTLGWWVALAMTLLLLMRFARPFISGVISGNIQLYPNGIMTLLSVITLLALIFGRTAGAPKTLVS